MAWRLITGRETTPLCELDRKSLGVLELTALPSIDEEHWVVLAPNVGEDFVGWSPPTGGDRGLGVVGFSMFPHLDHEDLPDNSMANAERWAAGVPVPGYAIDDQTAIKVTDGAVEVVSDGHWELFTP
jgi:dipeptidase E